MYNSFADNHDVHPVLKGNNKFITNHESMNETFIEAIILL